MLVTGASSGIGEATSSRVASVGGGVYAATKFGVNAFSESLRKEVTTQGVRVVVIEPGTVATEPTSHITDPTTRAATLPPTKSADESA